ncbi:MAG: cytochrome c oxidase subunit 3 [Bacteroidota bacterium]
MGKTLRSEMKIVEEPRKPISMHPKKFAMWLFLGSVMMLFASLTSAYIVRQAEGNWLYFELPDLFYYTTVIIIASSITMQWAYFAAKKDNVRLVKTLVTITSVLGVAFLAGQFFGWVDLVSHSIHLVGNPSGSFVYLITGLHGAHIISAVIFLLIVLNSAFRLRINSKNMAQMEMCTTYWHFLGVLWVYLFIFLLLNR